MALALIHQSPGASPLRDGAVLWRTCLRDVMFLDDEGTGGADPVLLGGDAYAVLVEIVCGLRSPLVGETEVQAQFKAFLSTLDPDTHGHLQRLGQRVLADAKTIRHQHLQGVGAHSYGHLAARHVPAGVRVAIVGTGALATQVAAALDSNRTIDSWGRREPDQRLPGFHLFAEAREQRVEITEPTALVIAAPASAADLAFVIRCYPQLVAVIDLRADVERQPLTVGVPVVTLDRLFADAAASAVAAARVKAARSEIATLARAYERREELRPFGWDDLCA